MACERKGFTLKWFNHWLNETFGDDLSKGEIRKITEEVKLMIDDAKRCGK